MRYFALSLLAISFTLNPTACVFAQEPVKAASADWTPLFDGKTFDGWYTYLGKHKKNEDPDRVFQIEDGTIHVYKDQPEKTEVVSGYLATETDYANYHLRLEFKWGEKRFKPRAEARRDAGVLYHITGGDAVWPRSIECQIQEQDVGDCFTVRGTQVTVPVETVSIETPGGIKQLPRYKPESDGGEFQTIGGPDIYRIIKSDTHEHDGWNTVELIVHGSEGSEHILNGHTVFKAKDPRQLDADKKTWQPLTHGRIALQAEFAEVYYRSVEIRSLPDGPLKHSAD